MNSRLIALLGCVALAVSGCESGHRTNGANGAAASSTGLRRGGHEACTSAGAHRLVERFLGGNLSDANQVVATFIASEPSFQWFSTRDRVGMDVAGNRRSLAGYLEQRRHRQVVQRLKEFHFNGLAGDHANFSVVITESDGAEGLTYPGKGAIDCTNGKIMVWSEGVPG